MRHVWILLCVWVFMATPLYAQTTHYVLESATGTADGTDWTNAFTDLPATLTRGDTYFIGDGSYSTYNFDDAESGSSVITIKKATEGDHGTETGWNAAFGDGTATFARFDFRNDYYTVDGQTANFSYGFLVQGDCGTGNECVDIGDATAASVDNIVLRDLSITPAAVCGVRGMKIDLADSITLSNIEIYNSDGDAIIFEDLTNSTLEYLHIHTRNNQGCGTHGDAIEMYSSSAITLRYSKIGWDGQQLFWGSNSAHGRFDLYGNIFFGGIASGKGLFQGAGASATLEIYCYNNTFNDVNVSLKFRDTGTSGDCRNNLFMNTADPDYGTSVTHDYNWYETGMANQGGANDQNGGTNPFLSETTDDFHLTAATNEGDTTIGATYNTDLDGVTRDTDGVWDRGAFEYDSGSPPDPPSSDAVVRLRFAGNVGDRLHWNSYTSTTTGPVEWFELSEDGGAPVNVGLQTSTMPFLVAGLVLFGLAACNVGGCSAVKEIEVEVQPPLPDPPSELQDSDFSVGP